MLRHIVCWKLKGTAEEQERVVCRFREMMDDLQKILPEILSCSIGVNLHEGEEAFDLCVDESLCRSADAGVLSLLSGSCGDTRLYERLFL